MARVDNRTRQSLVESAELTRQSIENSGRSRIDAIMDVCSKPDIVWAVWPNGQALVKGHKLFANAASRTSWIAVPCADEAEAVDLERTLA